MPIEFVIKFRKVLEFESIVARTSGKYVIIIPKKVGEQIHGRRFRVVLYEEVSEHA